MLDHDQDPVDVHEVLFREKTNQKIREESLRDAYLVGEPGFQLEGLAADSSGRGQQETEQEEEGPGSR